MNSKRIPITDLLKGIAVVLMILVHVVEKFSTEKILLSEGGKLVLFLGGPPVAPVFMTLMGYYIASSKKTTSLFIKRGIGLLISGFGLNIAINTNLFISINQGIFNLNPLPYLLGVDIFHFAGIAMIVLALIRSTLNKNYWITIFGILICGLLSNLLIQFSTDNYFWNYVTAFFYGSVEWSYFPLFPWLAFPLSGFLFFQLDSDKVLSLLHLKTFRITLSIGLVIFGILSISYAINVAANLQNYYHHTVLFTLWVIIFMIGYSLLIMRLDHLCGNSKILLFLKWLGKNLTIIYVIQWVIIGNLATVLYHTIDSPFYLALFTFSILMISCVVALFFIQIKANHQQIKIDNKIT